MQVLYQKRLLSFYRKVRIYTPFILFLLFYDNIFKLIDVNLMQTQMFFWTVYFTFVFVIQLSVGVFMILAISIK